MPKLGTGSVSFSATYLAPSVSTPTAVQLHVFFLAADNNGAPTGDSTNQATINITVAPAPTCAGKTCGIANNVCGQTVSCGTCALPQTCGGGGTPNQCGCTPSPNACAGKNCGAVADGCGGFVNCGTCPGGQTCNASNLCTAPRPASVPALGRGSLILLAVAFLLAAAIQFRRRRRDLEL